MAKQLIGVVYKKLTPVIVIFVLVGLVATAYLCMQRSLITRTPWDNAAAAELKIKSIRRISESDIKKVAIVQSGTIVELDPRVDGYYVAVLLDSLKRIRIENTKHSPGYRDRIAITLKHNKKKAERLLLIIGCFDPKRAPVISKSMRSDDLGNVVHDIFKHKGVKTKIQ